MFCFITTTPDEGRGLEMLRKRRIYSLCRIGIVLVSIIVFFTACTNHNENSKPININEQTTNVTTKLSNNEKINVYAGPGTEYIKLNTISKNEIKEYLKFENNWLEIDYGSKRGYISIDAIDDVDTDKIPHVVYNINANIYPYPTIYNSKIDINLFDEVIVYSKPNSSGAKEKVDGNNTVTILCSEINALKTYIQIEFETENGKRRGYCDSVDLLSWDNPLRNFDGVKEKNAQITYNGNSFYSSTGESTPYSSDWHKKEEKTIAETDFDFVSGIMGVVSGNDINDEAIKATEGKIQLYSTTDRKYINANIGNENIEKNLSVADFVISSSKSFIESGIKVTNLHVRLDEYKGERRIVIKTGTPIEYYKAGKETELNSLITEKNNTALTLVESKARADEMIKNMYPDLNKDKTYSMHMTFSNNFDDNNYGYYLVIDNNCEVYAVPIIHPGTSFNIYSEDDFVCDATWDLASAMIKLDDKSKDKILALLSKNGFNIDGFEVANTKCNYPNTSFEYNGHHYNFYEKVCETWEDAEKYCESQGGYLTIIDNEDENNKLYDYMISAGYESAYFGLTDVETEGVWKNVDGTEPKFINWSEGEPNNERGIENYAMFYFKSPKYQWNDGDFMHGTENDPAVFICEWDY